MELEIIRRALNFNIYTVLQIIIIFKCLNFIFCDTLQINI